MKKPCVVIQFEMAMPLQEAAGIPEAVRQALESMRSYATARIVGNYETEDDPLNDPVWVAKAQSGITVSSPTFIEVD